MSDVFSEAYWQQEFDVTLDDLLRLADFIRESGQAQDLTTLARRVVRGRLRYGPDMSAAVLPGVAGGEPVRLWDPAGEWKAGDRALLWMHSFRLKRKALVVGEVIETGPTQVKFRVDDEEAQRERAFERARPGSKEAQSWHEAVRAAVERLSLTSETEGTMEAVLLKHGERVVSRVLQALQSDHRFLVLDGRWFVRDLTVELSADQVRRLAAALARRPEPAATADLLPLVPPPLPDGDAGLFSVYAALLVRPDRFANVGTATRPLWRIEPVPWDRAVGAFFAYDPDTYEILLRPGERVKKRQAERLSALGLYDALVEPIHGP